MGCNSSTNKDENNVTRDISKSSMSMPTDISTNANHNTIPVEGLENQSESILNTASKSNSITNEYITEHQINNNNNNTVLTETNTISSNTSSNIEVEGDNEEDSNQHGISLPLQLPISTSTSIINNSINSNLNLNPPPPMMKGFLYKRGRKMIKTWRNRYFVLNKGILSYYESPIVEEPYGHNMKGCLDFKNYQISNISNISNQKSDSSKNKNNSIENNVNGNGIGIGIDEHCIYLQCTNIINNDYDLLIKCNITNMNSWQPAIDAHMKYSNS